MSIPDISKWNINFPEESDISSFNSIKDVKTSSLLSGETYSNLFEDLSLPKDNNDAKLLENNNFLDNSKNEELDDYYNNFYN